VSQEIAPREVQIIKKRENGKEKKMVTAKKSIIRRDNVTNIEKGVTFDFNFIAFHSLPLIILLLVTFIRDTLNTKKVINHVIRLFRPLYKTLPVIYILIKQIRFRYERFYTTNWFYVYFVYVYR